MKKLFIRRQWCKGCRVCVAFCPKNVLDIDSEDKMYMKNPEDCIYCGLCELRCPDLVIEIREESGDEAAHCGQTAAAGPKAQEAV